MPSRNSYLSSSSSYPWWKLFAQTVPSVEAFFLLDTPPQANWLEPENYEAILAASAPFQCDVTQVDEDSLAELFYTSGTSDTPKGVMLSHRNVYLHALSVIVGFQTSKDHGRATPPAKR